MGDNPFRPTYGKSPPLLAGRDEQLALIADALDEGAGAPARSALLIGQRGMGKTVMLNHVEDLARQRGWWVIAETAHGELVGRLVNDHLVPALRQLDDDATVTRLTSISAPLGLGAVSWATEEQHQRMAGLRSLLTRLTEVCEANGTGVLLTVDEIHGGQRDELRELSTVVQHAVREDRNVAFAAAGLPAAISQELLRDKVLTFLRRAEQFHLEGVAPDEAAEAIAIPIRVAGREIEPGALEAAVEVSGGYPYLIQLVGYHSWRQRPHAPVITIGDVQTALPAVRDRLYRQVIEPELADLSDRDRQFLTAMAPDRGSSRIADIAERMGVDGNYANQYRRRLLATELVTDDGHGRVRLNQPGLRSYLRSVGAGWPSPDEAGELARLRDALGPPDADRSALLLDRELADQLDVAPDRGDDVGMERPGPD